MRVRPSLTLALYLLATAAATAGETVLDTPHRPNWSRDRAAAVARSGRDDARVAHWLQQFRTAAFDTLAIELEAFARDPALPAPAREATVFRFAIALGDTADEPLPAGLLERLESWPAQTWVPHEENPAVGVPLFDIAAAAHGVRTAAQRRTGQRRGAGLLAAGADAWLAAYRQTDDASRRGFLDALDAAPPHDRAAVARVALTRSAHDSAAATVARHAVVALRDPDAVVTLLARGERGDDARLLRESAERFTAAERARMLLGAIAEAPAGRAALAIGLLAPDLQDRAEVTDSLFELLGDAALGASAALALARYSDPAVQVQLRRAAAMPGAAGRRAALALELRRLPAPAGGDRP